MRALHGLRKRLEEGGASLALAEPPAGRSSEVLGDARLWARHHLLWVDVGFSCSSPQAEPVKEEVEGLNSESGEQSMKKETDCLH